MGDAKRRGTFEERKAANVVKQEAKRKADESRKAAIEANKTPEQRRIEKENKAAMLQLAMLFWMWGTGWKIPYHPPWK